MLFYAGELGRARHVNESDMSKKLFSVTRLLPTVQCMHSTKLFGVLMRHCTLTSVLEKGLAGQAVHIKGKACAGQPHRQEAITSCTLAAEPLLMSQVACPRPRRTATTQRP